MTQHCSCGECVAEWWYDKRRELADNLLSGVGEQPEINISIEEIAQESSNSAPVSAEDIAIALIRGVSTDAMESDYKSWLLNETLTYIDAASDVHVSRRFNRRAESAGISRRQKGERQ